MNWTRDLLDRLEKHLVVAMARYDVAGDINNRDDVLDLLNVIKSMMEDNQS